MNNWIDQPQPGESWQQWLQTAECQRLLDNLPSRDLDPEPGPSERECRADQLYHEAIAWAASCEPDPAKRRLLKREAYTSPEMAAWHARAHGYAQAVEDGHRLDAERQALLAEQNDLINRQQAHINDLHAHAAAISRASRQQRAEAQAARERLLAALYRVGLVAIIAGGLLVLRVAQNWLRGW